MQKIKLQNILSVALIEFLHFMCWTIFHHKLYLGREECDGENIKTY